MSGPAFPKPVPRPKERKPLQRAGRIEAKRARRLDDPDDDPAFARWVVRLGFCCAAELAGATPCRGAIQGAHMTLSANQKGTGMKTPGRQRVPMCAKHHAEWDGAERDRKSMFFGWTKPERYDQAGKWVEAIQLEATPPVDDRTRALELQEMGLGRIVDGEGGAWGWVEGPAPAEGAA